jgi:hypothetical protein
MKVIVRGFVDGALHFEEFIEVDPYDYGAFRPLIERCADAIVAFKHHMMEIETLDQEIPARMRVVRFGPDADTRHAPTKAWWN